MILSIDCPPKSGAPVIHGHLPNVPSPPSAMSSAKPFPWLGLSLRPLREKVLKQISLELPRRVRQAKQIIWGLPSRTTSPLVSDSQNLSPLSVPRTSWEGLAGGCFGRTGGGFCRRGPPVIPCSAALPASFICRTDLELIFALPG